MTKRSSFAMLAVLAALLLVTARPAHGDCFNDDEGADDDTSCPQVGCCLLPCTCWPAHHLWMAGLHPAVAACMSQLRMLLCTLTHSLTNCEPMHLQGCATGEVVIPQGQRCGGEWPVLWMLLSCLPAL